MIITIDGPSGSGKSTLALGIAKNMHFFCMNSGYLYRGLAYVLKTFYGYDAAKIANPDLADVTAIFSSGMFMYDYQYGLSKVFWIDDITLFLKDPEISKYAAIIARHNGARDILRAYERSLVHGRDTVVEGRACGSVVYPQADIKFYINASTDVRAKRLQDDQYKRGKILTFEEALELIVMRDHQDSTREFEPLVIPHGAIILDSTKISSDKLLLRALSDIKLNIQNSMRS